MAKGTHVAEDAFEALEVLKKPPQIDQSRVWRLYVDGAKNNLGVGAGEVLKSPKGQSLNSTLG